MLKKLIPILSLFLLSGCGTTLNESWTNFRAYYNTYYNAEQNFEAGLDKVENQEIEIDAESPIRVHPSPVSAGEQDFAKAIEKGARILRKFPDSKWIDETLELIGKSYYYRKEYYSALQKFEEQYNVTESYDMKQRAVIWKARVLLDLEQYEEGVLFLEQELEELYDVWRPALEGEAQVLLAEHHSRLQNWEEVQDLLSIALNKLMRSPMKARTYFLFGQVLEKQGRYGEANFAYANVELNLPEFELLYLARRKQGETFRQMGNLEQASAIYESMRKDDKNYQRLPEINYEIARTEEEKGHIELAEKQYKAILRNRNLNSSQSTRAKTYYRLGSIYREHYRNYSLAASYFDSASTFARGASSRQLEESGDAASLASAYGEYSTYKNRIEQIDSLLWLGSLSPAEFDSVVSVLRDRELTRMAEQAGKTGRNVLTNVNGNAGARNAADGGSGTSGAYGFLNYRNSTMVAEAGNQFRAVWGARALVDHWRRIEAVRSRTAGETLAERSETAGSQNGQAASVSSLVTIDISDVPFTEEQKERKRSELAEARYELGNLFLLTLQMPDSAARYFRSVVRDHPRHELAPKALYALFEVSWTEGRHSEAARWADRLRQEYPGSIYARRVDERLGASPQPGDSPDSALEQEVLKSEARRLLADGTEPNLQRAESLRSLALEFKESNAAPPVHFEAIQHYIKLAKEQNPPIYASTILRSDSAAVATGGDLYPYLYTGAYWDSVRVLLDEFQAVFPDARQTARVAKIAETLRESDRETAAMKTCREIGVEPRIKSGMEQFLSVVEYPEEARSDTGGEITFLFVLGGDGTVYAYQLRSSETVSPAVVDSYSDAVKNRLEFLPLESVGPDERVRCAVTFPVRR